MYVHVCIYVCMYVVCMYVCMYVCCMYVCVCMYVCMYVSVFLISLYGTPNGPKSFLFGTAEFSLWASGAGNFDYSIKSLCTH